MTLFLSIITFGLQNGCQETQVHSGSIISRDRKKVAIFYIEGRFRGVPIFIGRPTPIPTPQPTPNPVNTWPTLKANGFCILIPWNCLVWAATTAVPPPLLKLSTVVVVLSILLEVSSPTLFTSLSWILALERISRKAEISMCKNYPLLHELENGFSANQRRRSHVRRPFIWFYFYGST